MSPKLRIWCWVICGPLTQWTWGSAAASVARHLATIASTAAATSSGSADASTSFNTDNSQNHFSNVGHSSLNLASLDHTHQPTNTRSATRQQQHGHCFILPSNCNHDTVSQIIWCLQLRSLLSGFEYSTGILNYSEIWKLGQWSRPHVCIRQGLHF